MPDFYWVVAEINELQVNNAGHCFLELVEKDTASEKITAKARATIWAYHFRMLSPYFETISGQRLSVGLKVMLKASIEFHEIYGMSLNITDINPAFTIGDLALQRRAIIQQLMEEGVFGMNRELELPQAPQRIAVISSKTAAGYGDFVNQLHNNPYGYAFQHRLFQATMQGAEAEASIINALEDIFEIEERFDIVVLIRGGGSQSDLNCFNSYGLAACIAQFPLPVVTGIGHERDETIADMVACLPLKTPTAVAEFIIQQAMSLHAILQELSERLNDAGEYTIRNSADKIQRLSHRLLTIIHSYARSQDRKIHELHIRLANAAQRFLLRKKQEIVRLEDKLHLLDPVNMLIRGYSITSIDGKVVRSAKELKKGKEIETIFHDGKIESIVK